MEVVTLIWRAVFSVAALFLITKLMGYRQISQLSFYDYIIGISIGSITAGMATETDESLYHSLISLTVFGLLAIAFSLLTSKSIRCRRFLSGKPVVFIADGQILYDNIKKQFYDLSELLEECRVAGYFNIADIKYAILETSGKISFLSREAKRACTPEDLSIVPPSQGLVNNLILDGKIMRAHLQAADKDEQWLKNELRALGLTDYAEVLLATLDCNGKFAAYPKIKGERGPQILG